MKNTRNATLDMLKVFATLLIVFHHYQQDGQGITGILFDGFIRFHGGSFPFGYIVELFFLISGICIFPYIEKIEQGLRFSSFYARRAARLLPLMAISGVVSAVLLVLYNRIYSGTDYYLGTPSLFGAVIQALGVQDGWVFTNPSLNNPTWYCSVLLLCYLLFYGVVYWSDRLEVSPYFGMTFLLLLGCGISTYTVNLPFLNAASSRGLYAFFAGVLLAAVMPRIQSWRYAGVGSLAVILAFGVEFQRNRADTPYLPFLLTFLLYPALIVLLQGRLLHRITGAALWTRWVKITYSVFIWHFPLYFCLFLLLPVLHVDPALVANQRAMVLFACVMQPVGWLSYRFLEQPLNKKMLYCLTMGEPERLADRVAIH